MVGWSVVPWWDRPWCHGGIVRGARGGTTRHARGGTTRHARGGTTIPAMVHPAMHHPGYTTVPHPLHQE